MAESFINQYRFNAEITPDRFELQRMSKRENETFKEYAQRWREVAAQVQPPLTEREHITTFVSTLKGVYFEKLVGTVTTNFSDLIITGGQVEDAIRHGKLVDSSAKPAESSSKKPFPFERKKGDTWTSMVRALLGSFPRRPHRSSFVLVGSIG